MRRKHSRAATDNSSNSPAWLLEAVRSTAHNWIPDTNTGRPQPTGKAILTAHNNSAANRRRPIRTALTYASGQALDISGPVGNDGVNEQTVEVGQAESFECSRRKNGDVVISYHGRVATILRGRRADRFVEDAVNEAGQELMARFTGNYKRGNERDSQRHPRNRGRR